MFNVMEPQAPRPKQEIIMNDKEQETIVVDGFVDREPTPGAGITALEGVVKKLREGSDLAQIDKLKFELQSKDLTGEAKRKKLEKASDAQTRYIAFERALKSIESGETYNLDSANPETGMVTDYINEFNFSAGSFDVIMETLEDYDTRGKESGTSNNDPLEYLEDDMKALYEMVGENGDRIKTYHEANKGLVYKLALTEDGQELVAQVDTEVANLKTLYAELGPVNRENLEEKREELYKIKAAYDKIFELLRFDSQVANRGPKVLKEAV